MFVLRFCRVVVFYGVFVVFWVYVWVFIVESVVGKNFELEVIRVEVWF